MTKLLDQLDKLHLQRGQVYKIKSAQLSNERIRLAKMLTERLGAIENDTGCFLIKPIPTMWSNR